MGVTPGGRVGVGVGVTPGGKVGVGVKAAAIAIEAGIVPTSTFPISSIPATWVSWVNRTWVGIVPVEPIALKEISAIVP